MEIKLLNEETISRIAAGEVIERPLNVVKELVENSIDAGSTAITVEIRDGGISMVRVTDNGCGIERDQIAKAFVRHATSKIRDAEDLSSLSSLGFRGEALASIASVAQVEMITKVRGSISGTRAQNDHLASYSPDAPVNIDLEEIGAPNGTTVIVRNLFGSIPVRRKFLRQPQTEAGYITDLIEKQALSHPGISFHYRVNGQDKLHTTGNGSLKELIYRIYGRETAGAILSIHAEDAEKGMALDGFLGKPEVSRSSRSFETFFINGRMLRSKELSAGLEEGYRTDLMQHRFPFAVLHLTMRPEDVDVNVHPSKMEVRFTDRRAVFQFLNESVHAVLHKTELIPKATMNTAAEERALARKENRLREQQLREASSPEAFESDRTSQIPTAPSVSFRTEKTTADTHAARSLGNTSGNYKDDISGNYTGNTSGNYSGNTSGNHPADNTSGNYKGDISGNYPDNTSGNYKGDISANSSGSTASYTSSTGSAVISDGTSAGSSAGSSAGEDFLFEDKRSYGSGSKEAFPSSLIHGAVPDSFHSNHFGSALSQSSALGPAPSKTPEFANPGRVLAQPSDTEGTGDGPDFSGIPGSYSSGAGYEQPSKTTSPAGSLSTGSSPANSIPTGSSPANSLPAGSAPTGSAPIGSAPAGSLPAGSNSASNVPANSLPAGSLPTDTSPANSLPTDRSPMGNSPAGSAPTDSVPADIFQEKNGQLTLEGLISEAVNEGEERILTAKKADKFKYIGQVFGTYWIIEYEKKLLIIDQHAAHEKVNYEHMMKRIEKEHPGLDSAPNIKDAAPEDYLSFHHTGPGTDSGKSSSEEENPSARESSVFVASQQLLPPAVIRLSGKEESAYLQYKNVFAAMGYEIEDFGGGSYAIRAVPTELFGQSADSLLRSILEEIMNERISGTPHAIISKVASMSCKAAVKGNNRLSETEARALIAELLELDNPYHCPHGRPTMIVMNQYEVDRKFKRIV